MENKVYITGDLHGDVRRIKRWYQSNPDEYAGTTMIVLGDTGFNYFCGDPSIVDLEDAWDAPRWHPPMYRDVELKEQAAKLPIEFFCVRGNHEMRPSDIPKDYCHKELYWGGYVIVEDKYPNIKYAIDGEWYDIPDADGCTRHTLVIGGAYSIDKQYRLNNRYSWFENEQLTESEREAISADKDCWNWAHNNTGSGRNVILTHTAPRKWEPKFDDLFLGHVDQSAVDKTMESWMDTVEEDFEYDQWYFGHFHDDRDLPGVNATMMFTEILPFGDTHGRKG